MSGLFRSLALESVFTMVSFLMTIPCVAVCQESPSHADLLWFWNVECPNGRDMGIRILVDGQTVYHSTFRACNMERTDALTKSEGRTRVFLSAGHTFQNEYRTAQTDRIEESREI